MLAWKLSKRGSTGLASLGALLVIVTAVPPLHAACNIIPGTSTTFRAALGTMDRPFARPGDFTALSLNPSCDAASRGFGATAADNVVTVVFTPPSGAADRNNVVILAADCTSLEAQRQACESRTDVGTATCVPVNGVGDPVGIEVFSTEGQRRLRFRFPDTDSLLQGANDDRTFSGPATIAITGPGDPLPCALASSSCAGESGLIACVDDFYAIDGTCGKVTLDANFPHFTALPPPNNYQAMCFDPVPPCTGTAPEVRFTTDTAGNLLLPMDWRGILLGQGVPVARLLRGSSSIAAFAGAGSPITIPGNSFLRSFSPEGGLLPPVFDPQSDPTAANEATLFGSADAPDTILRIARRSPLFEQCSGGANNGRPCIQSSDCPGGTCGPTMCQACAGGTNAGLVCHMAADCPGSSCGSTACLADSDCLPGIECGPSLFDFRTRYVADVGPVVIPRFGSGVCQAGAKAGQPCATDADCRRDVCVRYRVVAKDPVPLEGLNQTQELNAFVVSEPVEGKDLNGDADAKDDVVVLADRRTGQAQAIGAAGAAGRATVRIYQAPFSFPAVATEGDIVAFLESESATNSRARPKLASDENGDGDTFDTILRVFRLGGAETTASLTPPRAIDAAPQINGRSLAVSDGLVFYRRTEAEQARERTVRASVDSMGAQGNSRSFELASFSANGRFVVFSSSATNLTSDTTFWGGVFVRDLQAGTTELASVPAGGGEANFTSFSPAISADGRFVAFVSVASNMIADDTNTCFSDTTPGSCPDVFVRDRCLSNGTPVSGCTPTTERVSEATGGGQANSWSGGEVASPEDLPWISADGRFVYFRSFASNLVAGDTNGVTDIFVHDRQAGTTERVGTPTGGGEPNGAAGSFSLTPDARFLAFASGATNLVPNDTNGSFDVFVEDRCLSNGNAVSNCAATIERVSVASGGGESNADADEVSVSADGRYVAFASLATNLVPGDTNGVADIFVHDRQTGTTERVNVATGGEQANESSGFYSTANRVSISPDGRYVVFDSRASNLVPGDTNGVGDVFIHDRFAGTTERMSVSTAGVQANHESTAPAISPDDRQVVFPSDASNLVSGDTNTCGDFTKAGTCGDIFVRGIDAADTLSDVTGDGDVNDTVLEVLNGTSGGVTSLCPAGAGSVAAGMAAFLRPESAGPAPNLETPAPGVAGCPVGTSVPGGISLNGDTDATDDVVHFWSPATGVVNLHCAATAVMLSGTYVAALVSEAGQGQDLNGDGDQLDDVVMVHRIADGDPGSCASPGWVNTGQAADSIDISGAMVAFLTPEAAQGNQDFNGDGDTADRIMQVWDAAAGRLIPGTQAAEDFVLGPTLLAFRTREAAQNQDLNGDGDTADDVLQVFDLVSGDRLNTHQAVTPCMLEACDPRVPYRVLNHTVKFLTLEADQSEDLNGNGTKTDLVLQTFNVRLAEAQGGITPLMHVANPVQRYARTLRRAGMVTAAPHTTLGATSAGICTNTGHSCARDANCGGGRCFVPPGGCIRDLGTSCNPTVSPAPCPTGQFCQPIVGSTGSGTCEEIVNNRAGALGCQGDADCVAPDRCNDADQTFERLVGPLGETTGHVVFTSSGLCVEPMTSTVGCTVDADCATGEFCGKTGSCQRAQGLCQATADCPAGSTCTFGLLVATDRDSDGDEIPDRFDNCPTVSNIGQEDANHNGVGDACDLCGNSTTDPGEQCDDGNVIDGDGCDSNCTPTGCGNGVVSSGEQCDDGNLIDGDGCSGACGVEPGWHCIDSPSVCTTTCGDHIRAGREQCDDGNLTDGDGCDSNCTPTGCGNGVLTSGEQCDDGNLVNGDGCASTCASELGWHCTGSPSVCSGICGDGIQVGSEQCDDGNTNDHDACKSNCTLNVCGDGVVYTGVEFCDGATGCSSAGLSCRADCAGCEQLISGAQLVIRDKSGDASKRQIKVQSKDASITFPLFSANDPTVAGLTLELMNPITSETEILSLPAGHWTGLGRPAGSAGYKYKDTDQLAGPCTTGYWKTGKLGFICKGAQIGYSLDEPTQGRIGVTLTSGTQRECLSFGGTVHQDKPARGQMNGSFVAKHAPAPATCPVQ